MRKILLLSVLLLSVIVILSAGCVEEPDKIIGTWISEEHTSSTGTHYTHITDAFNSDHSMEESLYLDSGNPLKSIAIWLKNNDGTYTIIYRSVTFEMNAAADSGIVNSDLLKIDDLIFKRVDGVSGFAGSWVNSEPYQFNTGYNYIKLTANADGTGKAYYIDDDGKETVPIDLSWMEVGKNMFVISFSQPLQYHFDENGNLIDSYGIVYKKSE